MKINKLLIVGTMIACLFLTSSCHRHTDDTDDTTNTAASTMSVKFGSANAWTAKTVKGNFNTATNRVFLYAYPTTGSTAFPGLFLQLKAATGTTNVSESDFNPMVNPSATQFIEYFNNQLVTSNNVSYGDWWVKSGTITISAIDRSKMTMTATLNLNMFNAQERYIALSDLYSETTLQVTLNNVKITPVSKNIGR